MGDYSRYPLATFNWFNFRKMILEQIFRYVTNFLLSYIIFISV